MKELVEFIKGHSLSEFLIISDLDETLMHSDIYVSDDNKKAILELISMGGNFTVCSGRIIQSAEWMQVPTTHPSILYNGAGIYDFNTKELLWSFPMKDSFEDVSRELMTKFPGSSVCVYTPKGNYVLKQNAWSDWLNEIEGCTPVARNCSYKDIPGTIIKSCAMAAPEQIPEILSFMDEQRQADNQKYADIAYAPSLPPLIEITGNGAHKGVALRALSELTGFPLERIIYIGDNMNDLHAHAIAGYSIAPANGLQAVKDVVDYITVSNNEHIMVDILEKIKMGLSQ